MLLKSLQQSGWLFSSGFGTVEIWKIFERLLKHCDAIGYASERFANLRTVRCEEREILGRTPDTDLRE